MAVISKKDKLVEEAQKLSQRGQFDKAVKLYEQVMEMDPSSINLRQKLAELMIKAGRLDDARTEFETISRHFSRNGFYLKAIAVYKQLQKLFPSDFLISLKLGELNEKHGLTANALSEYKLVFDYYEKSGDKTEALKILDKMQTVDPGNVPIKIKLAEAYFQNDRKDDAYALFTKSATLLQERGDNATLSRLSTRIRQLFPEKAGFELDLLAGQVANGNAAIAVNSLQGLLRNNPDDKRAWDLIIEAYKRLDQPQKVKASYQHYLKFFPADPVPMAGMISCYAEEGNLPAALEQLDRYETVLFSAGFLDKLEKIYQSLNNIDPINIRIIEGMIRVARAADKESDVAALSSRLNSLLAPSDKSLESTFIPESCPDSPDPTDDIEIEIEIDIDIEESSGLTHDAEESVGGAINGDWLDSVGELFDSIATSPRGVRFGNEMDNSDAQSHFDLGLAFKEMGLYDEAINEFRKASSDTARRLSCLIMQGACLRERGEYDTALSMLNSLLNPGLSLDDSSAVKYELALTCESAGKTDLAEQLLNEIDSSNHGFRDVSSRLNAANLENSLDFSDEELRNFNL